MRHQMAGRKLGRTSSHRQALFSNLAMELIEHEQIRTTVAKAKDLRRVVEPLITKARAGDLAARREVAKTIKRQDVLKKLFDDVAPRFKETPGGYTRVLKAGFRQGDNAPMAIIELTAFAGETGKTATAKPKAKPAVKAAPKKEAAPAEEVPAEEVKAEAAAEEAPVAEETTEADAKS